MEKADASAILKRLILVKESEQYQKGKLLKEHFHLTYESLKPINIIKNTLKEAVSISAFKNNLVNTAIGITSGFITKKILIGKSNNPFAKLFGIVLEMAVAGKVTNHADEIKAIGGIILKKIINRHSDTEKA